MGEKTKKFFHTIRSFLLLLLLLLFRDNVGLSKKESKRMKKKETLNKDKKFYEE